MWHLSGWKLSNHVRDQSSSNCISHCRAIASSFDVTVWKILASSANKNPSDLMLSRRSLMYITKSRGPNTVPWGIQLMTSAGTDFSPLTTTTWLLLLRYSVNPLSNVTLYAFSLPINRMWGTVSNAFIKSRYTVSTTFPPGSPSRTCLDITTIVSQLICHR